MTKEGSKRHKANEKRNASLKTSDLAKRRAEFIKSIEALHGELSPRLQKEAQTVSARRLKKLQSGLKGMIGAMKADAHELRNCHDLLEARIDSLMVRIMRREDILVEWRELTHQYPGPMRFFRFFLTRDNLDLNRFADVLDLSAEVRETLVRWKARFAPLKSVIRKYELDEQNRKNSWTNIESTKQYNAVRRVPQIEMNVLSGSEIVFSTRDDADDIMGLGAAILKLVTEGISECQGKEQELNENFISSMKRLVQEASAHLQRISDGVHNIEITKGKSLKKKAGR